MAPGGWDEKRLVKSQPFQIKKLRRCLKYKLNDMFSFAVLLLISQFGTAIFIENDEVEVNLA